MYDSPLSHSKEQLMSAESMLLLKSKNPVGSKCKKRLLAEKSGHCEEDIRDRDLQQQKDGLSLVGSNDMLLSSRSTVEHICDPSTQSQATKHFQLINKLKRKESPVPIEDDAIAHPPSPKKVLRGKISHLNSYEEGGKMERVVEQDPIKQIDSQIRLQLLKMQKYGRAHYGGLPVHLQNHDCNDLVDLQKRVAHTRDISNSEINTDENGNRINARLSLLAAAGFLGSSVAVQHGAMPDVDLKDRFNNDTCADKHASLAGASLPNSLHHKRRLSLENKGKGTNSGLVDGNLLSTLGSRRRSSFPLPSVGPFAREDELSANGNTIKSGTLGGNGNTMNSGLVDGNLLSTLASRRRSSFPLPSGALFARDGELHANRYVIHSSSYGDDGNAMNSGLVDGNLLSTLASRRRPTFPLPSRAVFASSGEIATAHSVLQSSFLTPEDQAFERNNVISAASPEEEAIMRRNSLLAAAALSSSMAKCQPLHAIQRRNSMFSKRFSNDGVRNAANSSSESSNIPLPLKDLNPAYSRQNLEFQRGAVGGDHAMMKSQTQSSHQVEVRRAALKSLYVAMEESKASQIRIHDWDRKMGLRKSHSQTMRNSSRSRKKLILTMAGAMAY